MLKKLPILLAAISVFIACETEDFDIAPVQTNQTNTEETDTIGIDPNNEDVSDLCIVPQRLAAGEITTEKANVTWDAENAQSRSWEIRYAEKPVSLDDTFTAIINDSELISTQTNTVTINNLKSSTEYIVIVRTRCSDTEFSKWSSSLVITTL